MKKSINKRKKALYSELMSREGIGQGLVGYALRYNKGDKIHPTDICNARMIWSSDMRERKAKLQEIVMDVKITPLRYVGRDVKLFDRYLKYILQDSPWSECFLVHKVGLAKRYGLKFNLDKDISQLMGAAIAVREGWEYHWKLKEFNRLVRYHHPHTAYLVSAFREWDNKGYKRAGMNGGHCVLNRNMEWESLHKFFLEGYSKKKKWEPMRTSEAYTYKVYESIATVVTKKLTMESMFYQWTGRTVEGGGFAVREHYPKDACKKLALALDKEFNYERKK